MKEYIQRRHAIVRRNEPTGLYAENRGSTVCSFQDRVLNVLRRILFTLFSYRSATSFGKEAFSLRIENANTDGLRDISEGPLTAMIERLFENRVVSPLSSAPIKHTPILIPIVASTGVESKFSLPSANTISGGRVEGNARVPEKLILSIRDRDRRQ